MATAQASWVPQAAPRLPAAVDRALIAMVSMLLVIPCFWQAKIFSSDLPSHIYNAWLAGEIQQGRAPGLEIVSVKTNVLADWALEALLQRTGPGWPERIVETVAVLLFFWGAFFLIHQNSGRWQWVYAPSLAMLSYGLIYHLGFLNFYISSGISLWILAVLWKPDAGILRFSIAGALAVVALLAHALPLAWAVMVLAYWKGSWHVDPKWRFWILVAALGALAALRVAITGFLPYLWNAQQFVSVAGMAGMLGVEQAWVFGHQYLAVAIVLGIVWCALILDRVDAGNVLSDARVQLWILHMAAFGLIPSAIQLPGYAHTLAFIPQRISLFTGVLLCLMTSTARHRKGVTRMSVVAVAAFFTFLYVDYATFQRVEDEVTEVVAGIPPGSSIAARLEDTEGRVNALAHMVDRACIGRCFSYGNYEPATHQFRIRPLGPNRIAAPNMSIIQEIEEGRHTVTDDEAPLYSLCTCPGGTPRFCLQKLNAGERTCVVSLELSQDFGLGGIVNYLRSAFAISARFQTTRPAYQ